MAEFRVTYQTLHSTADTIKEAASSYRNAMDEIRQTMDSVENKWKSDAAEDFRTQFNKLAANFESYSTVINQYSAYLEKTAAEYEQVDRKVGEETSKLDGSALFV